MMDSIKWSDNTCTVGWTCITVNMSHHEFPWLSAYCPKGTFSACFYAPHYDVNTELGFTDYLDAHLLGENYMNVFYFTFPFDEAGLVLLKALCLVDPDIDIETVRSPNGKKPYHLTRSWLR